MSISYNYIFFASFVLILFHCSLYVIISNPNDANSFWTYDFDNAYFNNDDEMHYGDNEFDEEYSDLDEEQFNGSYDGMIYSSTAKLRCMGFAMILGMAALTLTMTPSIVGIIQIMIGQI